MYLYEVAALCGVKVSRIREVVDELTESKIILPDWSSQNSLDYPAVSILINHFNIDTSDEQQIITILSIAREKKFNQRGIIKKIHKK